LFAVQPAEQLKLASSRWTGNCRSAGCLSDVGVPSLDRQFTRGWSLAKVPLFSKVAGRFAIWLLLGSVLAASCSGREGFQTVSEQAPSEALFEDLSQKTGESERGADSGLKLALGSGVGPAFYTGNLTCLFESPTGFCCRRLLCLCSRGPPGS
jgi:hypothetical protein